MKQTLLLIAFSLVLGISPVFAQTSSSNPHTSKTDTTKTTQITSENQTRNSSNSLFSKDEALLALKDLANNPLSSQSGAERRELIIWLDKTPEVDVQVCGVVEGFLPKSEAEKNDSLKMVLFAQILLSNAQYQLEHPEEKNEMNKQIAGVDGMLRVYHLIQTSYPQALDEYAEKLQDLKNNQTLYSYVQQSCKIK